MGYNVVTQLFPALVLILRRTAPIATRPGAIAGIAAGEATVAPSRSPARRSRRSSRRGAAVITDLNVGIVALVVNVVVIGIVTLTARRMPTAALRVPTSTSQ